MHTVYITAVTTESQMHAVKAVREAMLTLGTPEATFEGADMILEALKRDGCALVGTTPDRETAVAVKDALRANGFGAQVDLDPERHKRRMEARRMTDDGASPEDVFRRLAPGQPADSQADRHARLGLDSIQDSGDPPEGKAVYSTQAYETALVLMGMTNGNPLAAAAHAHSLGRTTEDPDMFGEVIEALAGAYPWLEGPLRQNGLWPAP